MVLLIAANQYELLVEHQYDGKQNSRSMKFFQGLVLVDPHQNQRFIIVHFEANPCLAVLESLR